MLDVLRHQGLEGVLATVVRYYGGVKLGAGGLVRAYTDCIAQAVRTVEKVPIVRLRGLACTAPYALEGMIRREIEGFGAVLTRVSHGEQVEFAFSLAEAGVDALVARLNESGQGRIDWISESGS